MEVEASFRCPEIERVEQDVKCSAFELVGRTHQIDHYSLVGESNADGSRHYLRLRENTATDEGSLEYHRIRSEYETDKTALSIDNIDDAMKILTFHGYEIKCVVNEQRTEYANGEVLLAVDHIEGLGDVVELKLEGELSEETEQTVAALIDQFDLDDANRVTYQGSPELILQHEQ